MTAAGAAAGSAAEASCIEAGKHADAAEAESSVFLQGAHAAPKGENSQAAAQSTLQTDEGDARGAPRQQAPYSANFKEVVPGVQAATIMSMLCALVRVDSRCVA